MSRKLLGGNTKEPQVRRSRASKNHDEAIHVVSVTTALLSHTDERLQRQRRYAIAQGIRLVCFVLAVVLPVPLAVKLLLLLAALVIPLMGVVAANGGPVVNRRQRANAIVDRQQVVPETVTRLSIDPGRVVDAER